MDELLKKWESIINILEVDDEIKMEFARYAEHFLELETLSKMTDVNKSNPSLLPINLKVLKELGKFKFTDNPDDVDNYTFTIDIDDYPDLSTYKVSDMNLSDKNKISSIIDNSIVDTMVKELGDKNLVVYSLINSITISEGNNILPRLKISTRIKIIE